MQQWKDDCCGGKMKQKQVSAIRIVLILITALSMTNALRAQKNRLTPLSKIKVTGDVTIIKGCDGTWVISPWFSVRRNGSQLTGLAVTLEDQPLRETMPGQYAGIRITDITPVAGNRLQFSIASRHFASPGSLPKKSVAISGSAVIGSLAQITVPHSGSSFSLADLGATLAVSWTGGTPPFSVWMGRVSGAAAPEVFSQTGLPGFSYSLPAMLFLAGNSYRISVSYDMKPFLMKKNKLDPPFILDESSVVELRCAIFTGISME
jgi:hypothetical protein